MSCGCICSNKIFSTTRKTHGGQLLSRGFSAHCVYYRVKGGAAVTDSEIARLMKAGDERGAEEMLRRFGALIRMQPISQIAAETGLSLRAVEGRLYRIRKQLGRALGGERNG